MTISQMILSFFVYSFIGWLYESTLCSFYGHRRFINRGFLLGPYCPIYGVGALMCYLCFHTVQNTLLLFLLSALACGAIEYATSYAMEKLFHTRWWDYSQMPFQLHGRVCLYGVALFGSGSVLICRNLQPLLLAALNRVQTGLNDLIAGVLVLFFTGDLVMTLVSWSGLNRGLKALHDHLSARSEQAIEGVSDRLKQQVPLEFFEEKNALHIRIQDLNLRLKRRELRFLNAFPNLCLLRYERDARHAELREHIRSFFGK